MATNEKTWNVANRLHSLKDSDNPEVNHIIAGADEIYDDAKHLKQSEINSIVDTRIGLLVDKDVVHDNEFVRIEMKVDDNRAEINRKQFEVGAAEFDPAPIEGSDRLLRSGAIYAVTLGAVITDNEMDNVLTV